ncbi:MAG: glutathione S-transferase family protein [Calothrix sp. FI2-JRJ7]|jgi:glutathione S-transferase|nr:glutathione S-transferase family protein [Calothrix sp. FI2-JRJ7]
MLKLYAGARSRASIVQWYLEELSVPYELVILDMAAGEHRQDAFLAINPFGKVPAIVDGDFKLWESGAILMYLAEKHAGITSVETRAVLNQWVLFGNSTLATGVFIEASREKEMPRLMTALNNMFEKQPFIMGDEFTVADVAVGSILCYIPIMLKLDLSAYPAVLDYMKRMTERDGFKKSIGAR